MEDTSNIVQRCCMMREIQELRNTILLQSQEIGKVVSEKNEYKVLYENLLMAKWMPSYI